MIPQETSFSGASGGRLSAQGLEFVDIIKGSGQGKVSMTICLDPG